MTPPNPAPLTGKVAVLRDGFGLVELDDGAKISLSRRDMQCLYPGDRVAVRRSGRGIRGSKGHPRGSLSRILERNTHQLVGLLCHEAGHYFVRPANPRIGHDLELLEPPKNIDPGQLVVAQITRQPSPQQPAAGRILEALGDPHSTAAQVQMALRNFAIPHQWPKAALAEAKQLGAQVAEADKRHRLDLRSLPLVTIDGADAQDFDDAVCAEKQTDGGWQLWVAIADVAHYVRPGSALDQEAQERGTSVYFPDQVVPMLPEALSNGLCSLMPNVDRLALVCRMHIDPAGAIKKFDFAEALIRSHRRLTYSQVARALGLEDRAGDQAENQAKRESLRTELGPLAPQLDTLHDLYRLLYQARTRRGALDFDSTEVRFAFNAERNIARIRPVPRTDAHRLIEECMLAANICAAQFLTKNALPGLYRVHLPPTDEKLAILRAYLAGLGLTLGGDPPAPVDFQRLAEAIAYRPDRQVIQTMIMRTQQQAVYQPDNRGHFGLAYPAYAHFTSPIRRYPDLLLHRALRAAMRTDQATPPAHIVRSKGAKPQPIAQNYPYGAEKMQTLGTQCSASERRAEEATRDIEQWLKCDYLRQREGETFPGIIAAVTHFGLFVELADLAIQGLIHIANLPGDYYDYDADRQMLIGRDTQRTFQMGDALPVRLAQVDLDERSLDLLPAEVDPRTNRTTPRNLRRPRSNHAGTEERRSGYRRSTRRGSRR
ncbi:MAG: ribonuclease R [Cellvibrionales bacterium]|nr:ribonuclease R [Cellvibrionales bacterium]